MTDYMLDQIMGRCESKWLEAPEYDDEEIDKEKDDDNDDDI